MTVGHMNRWAAAALAAASLGGLILSPARAVQPQRWLSTNEAEFSQGETKDTIVTNLGDVKLASDIATLAEMPKEVTIVFDTAVTPDGTMYFAGGPEARLLKRTGDDVSEVLTLKGEQIFTLSVFRDHLLLGVSSEHKSRLALLNDDGSLTTLASMPGARYIWDILPAADGKTLYVAVGTKGKVVRVLPGVPGPNALAEKPKEEKKDATDADANADDAAKADDPDADADADANVEAAEAANADAAAANEPAVVATIELLLDTAQNNVLCLGLHENELYAGTDTDGLIYRIDLAAKDDAKPYVVFDAPEPEIAAMIVSADGVVYAGTADAEQARPGRLEQAVQQEEGRIIPGEAPEKPAKPEKPEIPGAAPEPQPMDGAEKSADGDDKDAAAEDTTADATDAKADDAQADADAAPAVAAEAKTPATDTTAAAHPAFEAHPEPQAPAQPTQAQRDRLRELVKMKLLEARKSGRMQVGGGVGGSAAGGRGGNGGPQQSGNARPVAQAKQKKPGNAVYRVDSNGFVTEVFRETVMVLDLALIDDDAKLIVATGDEGQIYQVNVKDEETAVLADLDGEQVTAITPDGDALLFSTANPAHLIRMTDKVAKSGTFTSKTYDAGQISLFGMIDLNVKLPAGTSVSVQTRSGNVEDPEMAPWSEWTDATTFASGDDAPPLAPRSVKISSPPARFLQYRLNFAGDGDATPVVSRVMMTFVMPNLKPVVASIRAGYPAPHGGGNAQPLDLPPAATVMGVKWEATDPNGDRLLYDLQYQPAGSEKWLTIAEKSQEDHFEWQTQRVPDGRYILKVTASDKLDNPPDMAKSTVRSSDPIVVDNTAPAIEGLKKSVDGNKLTLTATATDALLPIGQVGYILDDADAYEQVLPDDLIFDSTSEAFTVTISDLAPGPHVVTLRVVDVRGNARYQSILFDAK